MKTNFTEMQYRRIIKMALEKGILNSKAGAGLIFKKTDSEVAEMLLEPFLKDIEGLINVTAEIKTS